MSRRGAQVNACGIALVVFTGGEPIAIRAFEDDRLDRPDHCARHQQWRGMEGKSRRSLNTPSSLKTAGCVDRAGRITDYR